MSGASKGLSPSQLSAGLRVLARILKEEGTPGRTYAEQALSTDYQVSAPEFVEEFAARHDLPVTRMDSGAMWAELPIGTGTLYGRKEYSPTYRGAVVLRVVFSPDEDDES